MKMYEGMLPNQSIPGHLGYYPVTNKREWDELPDLYKVMQWESVKDPHDKGELKAVKSVIFDVVYMEPYGISAKVSVHPSEIQKILFCSFRNKDCLLYSVCGIELEGGIRLGAKWLQDSITGAFAIVSNGQYVGTQGGFRGFIPEGITRNVDGSYKYDYSSYKSKITHYEILNPFRNGNELNSIEADVQEVKCHSSLNEKIQSAESRTVPPESGTTVSAICGQNESLVPYEDNRSGNAITVIDPDTQSHKTPDHVR